uniref:Uncharacterized protein n=1 Tax=Timema monikensis TaxID=170555 RepID=A0A7R9ELE0_9NEOP|nr:unnamed protein product [Timema monikensis]
MLGIDNPETQQRLPLLHLQQMLTTLQFYATEGLQFPTRETNWELCECCSMTRPTSLEFDIEETAPTSLSRAPGVRMEN